MQTSPNLSPIIEVTALVIAIAIVKLEPAIVVVVAIAVITITPAEIISLITMITTMALSNLFSISLIITTMHTLLHLVKLESKQDLQGN